MMALPGALMVCALALGPADTAPTMPEESTAEAVLARIEIETTRRHAALQ
jgi:hypothetical protein